MNDTKNKLVIVDYKDVSKPPSDENDLSLQLEDAYGSSSSSSLGILAIRNVPGFVEAKQRFLPMAHTLAHLPSDYLQDKLTDAASMYNAGWSHGKEKLGDKPDLAKGSFYFNPLTDVPGTEAERQQYPASYPCNVWPDEDMIPGFEGAAKHLGRLMKQVVVRLSRHIDAFAAQKVPNHYHADALYHAMKETEKAKGRLLYYFPLSNENEEEPSEDSWIGWHNDSGFLTALAGDLYIHHETGKVVPVCPDPQAGLYVVDRNDQVVHVDIPDDCMAVQMGECVQILTGGAVTATPHCVRGISSTTRKTNNHDAVLARIAFPCFIDTPPTFALHMPQGCTREQVLTAGVGSARVPPLGARWTEDGMAFGDFLQQTFAHYYSWSKTKTNESNPK